jgi:MFS family permease
LNPSNPVNPNPYAPPTAAIGEGLPGAGGFTAYLEGDRLVVQKEAPLPPVCMKCGSREVTERRKQLFVWNPQWAIILMLVTGLIGMIVMVMVQKKGTLHLPLCAPCARRWKTGVLFSVFGVMGMIGGLIGGSLAIAIEPILGIGAMLGAVVALIVLVVLGKRRFLQATKVDERMIWLKSVHPEAAAAVVAAAQGH